MFCSFYLCNSFRLPLYLCDFLFSLFVAFICALFLLCLRVNRLCLVFCVMSGWRSVTSVREKDSGP